MADTFRPPKAAQATAAALFESVLCALADAFTASITAFQTSDDPEHPHRARVTLRRLRSALMGFAPILDAKQARRLSDEARALFRALGPLRDADVGAEHFTDEADRASRQAALATLRDETRAAMLKVDAPGFAGRIELTRLLGKGQRAQRLALADQRLLGALALQSAWTQALAYGPDIASLSPEQRHEFRKDMKKLRYLAEFFGPGWSGTQRKKFLRRMELVQDDLGALNDIATHADPDQPDPKMEKRVASLLKDATSHWRKLRKAGVWWLEGAPY